MGPPPAPYPRPPRNSSPVWDIELDVTPPHSPVASSAAQKQGEQDNPNWVVDLDTI